MNVGDQMYLQQSCLYNTSLVEQCIAACADCLRGKLHQLHHLTNEGFLTDSTGGTFCLFALYFNGCGHSDVLLSPT